MGIANIISNINRHPFNNNPLPAYTRFLQWQIKSRLFNKDFIYNWVSNTRFVVRRGDTGLTANIYNGLAEFHDMAFVLHALRANDRFLDIGANAGSYSILAGAAAGADVLCVEPLPETYAKLLKQIDINNMQDHVKALNIGVSDKPATLQFTADLDCGNHVIAKNESHADTTEVQVDTIDNICTDFSPYMIKMDTEGYENFVIDGATKTLENDETNCLVIELYTGKSIYNTSAQDIHKKIVSFGFKPFRYNAHKKELTALENKLNTEDQNTIYLKNPDDIRARIATAKKYTLFGKDI